MYFARTMLVLDFIEARSEVFWLELTPFFICFHPKLLIELRFLPSSIYR